MLLLYSGMVVLAGVVGGRQDNGQDYMASTVPWQRHALSAPATYTRTVNAVYPLEYNGE